ncbi:MAG TPA: ABC transporter substrate-binding protein [Alphaproteobacteria bacterium]|nr:ABC transporter substrate-binding protein [Alphaproteobacteria bacterium]
MIRCGATLIGALWALMPAPTFAAYIEPPSLAAEVAAGRLPPIGQRLPETPLTAMPEGKDMELGRHGGELRFLIGRPQDVRLMVVYSYARLVVYDTKFELQPDIVEAVESDGDRVFTFKLRRGHRWSDGRPFTGEDFRYYWQDVVLNKQLSPLGPPQVLMVDGKPPRVEFPDATTVRYSWASPNPHFLPALAGPSPLYIYRPAHYLKQFHAKYTDAETLTAEVKKAGVRNWQALHNRRDNQYRNDNPELPTLDPWVVQTKPPADRFVFVRNPYFHRVDPEGRQLPYIDRVAATVADGRLIPAKTGSGEADLQARGISFNNYTFLRQASKRNEFTVHLWNTAKGSHVALFPNLNASDPTWRRLNRDQRFRRALSLAINRREINQVIYFGLALEAANTVLPQSPLYRNYYRLASAQFDLRTANRLLDEIGMVKRDGRGVRLLPDGRPLELIVETAGEDTEQTDVLELIHDSWLEAGVKLFSRPSQREVFRNRIFAGQTKVSVWSGLENGLPTAATPPDELAPTSQQQLQWPKWGQFVETRGGSGEAVDDPSAKELMRLNEDWRLADSRAERERIWHRMLEIHAEQIFTIGLIAGVKQPVVVSNHLRNVPAEGVYNWDPGSFFGIYRPELFWFDESRRTAASAAQ